MEKKAFYTATEAVNYANELAIENKGCVSSKLVSIACDDVDSPAEIDSWSGEIAAYEVMDGEFNVIAKIGYWEA